GWRQAAKRGEALAEANDALIKKQALTAVVSLARTLAEIGVRGDEAALRIARKRLGEMTAAYADSPELGGFLRTHAGPVTRVKEGKATSEVLINVQINVLTFGRLLKAEVLKVGLEQVREIMTAERKAAFGVIEYCARQLVEGYRGQPYRADDPNVTEFWSLY